MYITFNIFQNILKVGKYILLNIWVALHRVDTCWPWYKAPCALLPLRQASRYSWKDGCPTALLAKLGKALFMWGQWKGLLPMGWQREGGRAIFLFSSCILLSPIPCGSESSPTRRSHFSGTGGAAVENVLLTSGTRVCYPPSWRRIPGRREHTRVFKQALTGFSGSK